MIIKIKIPKNNQQEREYILSVIFRDFLGLSYELVEDETAEDYIIEIDEKMLIVKDSFFSKHSKDLSYLSLNNIPENLFFLNVDIFKRNPIPMIYGENEIKIEDEKIECGLDIFASAFFMLSRWEEMVILEKDVHGRCKESEMFVVKHNVYKRALVNEYVELLKELLRILCPTVEFKQHKFSCMITHDIDALFRFADPKRFFRALAGDIILRKNPLLFFKTIGRYIAYKAGLRKDPYDTFDEMMDLSESIETKSHFYFKPSLNGEFDASYSIFDKRVLSIMQNIAKRGHHIGIHPSKNTFHNAEMFKIEADRLRSFEFPIKGGRQHYLLYDMANSFDMWENEGLFYDNGLGFYDRAGFRCGVCYPYAMFDIQERRKRKLIQRSLIVMEGAIMRDFKNTAEQVRDEIIDLIRTVQKYQGEFVFLWHNNWGLYEYERYKTSYLDVINEVKRIQNE